MRRRRWLETSAAPVDAARMTDTISTIKRLSGIFAPWRCQPRPLLSGNVE
jgi:hypothetical protein